MYKHQEILKDIYSNKRMQIFSIFIKVLVIVLALLFASMVIFNIKNIQLEVDGKSVKVTTMLNTVEDVLNYRGVSVVGSDEVTPSLDTPISNNEKIVVSHTHPIRLIIDGKGVQIWSSASTVSQVIKSLGLAPKSVITNISTSVPLNNINEPIQISTTKYVTVNIDNVQQKLFTSAQTVGMLLGSLDIESNSKTSVPLDSPVTNDMHIDIKEVESKNQVKTVLVPFKVIKKKTSDLYKGETVVKTQGKVGIQKSIYNLEKNKKQVINKKSIGQLIVKQPVAQVVLVGTKKRPEVPDVSVDVSPGSAQSIAQDMLSDYGWDSGQFKCLVALWNRESGWRVNANNPYSGAYGIPQALPGNKMASAGSDWRTNPATQIKWGLGYIKGRYSSPCGAWAHSESSGWY
jgi:uncharacterized protein YabE (DUF348 family)